MNHCIHATCLTCKIEYCQRCLDAGEVAAASIEILKAKAQQHQAVQASTKCPVCNTNDHCFMS